jgi:hypothetical protein
MISKSVLDDPPPPPPVASNELTCTVPVVSTVATTPFPTKLKADALPVIVDP